MNASGWNKTFFRIGLLLSFTLTTSLLYGQSRTPEVVPTKLDTSESTERLAAAKFRLSHARELLGKGYSKSVVAGGETVAVEDLNKFISGWIHDKLPQIWRFRSTQIAQTLIDEARKYHFDPIFLVAVIQNESKWNPSAKGDVGELGLMQIRPSTAQWFSKRHRLPFSGKLSLYNPEVNIRVGAAYLAHLRGNFSSHGRLYLAAYNMGGNAVSRALKKKVMPKEYAAHVMHYYIGIYEDLADFAGELAEKMKPATVLASAAPAPVPNAPAPKPVATGLAAMANAPQGHAPAAQDSQQVPSLQLYPSVEQD